MGSKLEAMMAKAGKGLAGEKHSANSPHRTDASKRRSNVNKTREKESCISQRIVCGGRQPVQAAVKAGSREWCWGNGEGPAGAGKAKGRQSRRRGRQPAAQTGQGGGASPAPAPAGLLGKGGEGITRLGEERRDSPGVWPSSFRG